MIPRRRPRRRGSSLVETALTLTIVLMMIFGIMEFGRAVWAYNYMASLARAGTRYALVRGSSASGAASATDVQTYVRSQVVGLDPAAVSVTTTWAPDNKPGSTVTVQVGYQIGFVAPYLPATLQVGSTSKAIVAE